jgi:hypothetical protein
MKSLRIDILNSKAIALLKNLESLGIIKIHEADQDESDIPHANKKPKLSEQVEGKLSKEVAEEMQAYVKKSREEWDRDF